MHGNNLQYKCLYFSISFEFQQLLQRDGAVVWRLPTVSVILSCHINYTENLFLIMQEDGLVQVPLDRQLAELL